MKDKIFLSIISSFIVMLALNLSAASGSEPINVRGYATSTGTAPKRLATATVKEVKDSVMTVEIYKKEHAVLVDDKTRLTRNGKPAALSDIKPGMKVSITFIERSGHKVATAVILRSDAKAEKYTEPKPVLPNPQQGIKTGPSLLK